jgi:hypothetical protein
MESKMRHEKTGAKRYVGPDNLQQHYAKGLALDIENWWLSRGYHGIRAWTVAQAMPIGKGEVEELYFVRSNIGADGYPPRSEGGNSGKITSAENAAA